MRTPKSDLIRAVPLAAALSLLSAAALGQPAIEESDSTNGFSLFSKVDIYYKPVSGQSVEALALERAIRNELEQSRDLNLVTAPAATSAMQIDGPLGISHSADHTKIAITYELTPLRGEPRGYTASCKTGEVEKCAEVVVRRAERLARDGVRTR